MLEQIIDLVCNYSTDDLMNNKDSVLKKFKKMKLSKKDQNKLFDCIFKVLKITNNPKTQRSLIRSYYRTIIEGIDKDGRDSSITIEITKRCNKNCKYCYSNSHKKSNIMKDSTLEKIIILVKKEFKHIFITGGEPTLDNRIFKIAKNNPDIIFYIFTNGSTIDNNYAKKLSKFGNIIPMIAVDGSTKDMHDSLKGYGSYKEITDAINNLNKNDVSWGYISMVTEKNARNILNQEFVKNMNKKGAFIARYLEYLPVGPYAIKDLILSGKTYQYLEKRKKEIIESGDIYIQETIQKKCKGLLSFDINGNIKNCPFFHYSKYNILENNFKESVKNMIKDWISFDYAGECPLYSDPIGFKNHLEKLGWKHIIQSNEEYLTNPKISKIMKGNYKKFLEIKKSRLSL